MMKLTGIQLKKLSVLLAILLCCVFAFATPVVAKAVPSGDVTQWESVYLADKNPLELAAGESSAGEVKGMLEIDRSVLTPLLQLCIGFYPQFAGAVPVLQAFPSSKDDRGLHIIFIKGP